MARIEVQPAIEFDWPSSAGPFTHPLRRVYDDLLSLNLRYGTAADTPSTVRTQPGSSDVVTVGGILSDTARGTVRVYDSDGRFDPDNPRLRVNEEDLRRPVPVRYMQDDVEVWRGVAVPRYGAATRPVEFFEWDLEGVHGEDLINTRVELVTSPGSVAAFTDDIPVDFSTQGPTVPLGLVTFNGTRIKLYEALARFVGGWLVEGRDGTLRVRTLRDAFNEGNVIQLDLSMGYDDTSVRLAELEPLVVTRATMASQGFVPVVDETTGEPRQVSVGTVRVDVSQGRTPLTFRPRTGDLRRIDSWGEPQAIGAAVTVLNKAPGAGGAAFIQVALDRTAGPGQASVSFPAFVSEVQVTNERTHNVVEAERRYGRRDLGLAPWMASSLAGGTTVVEPWVNVQSEPLEWFQVTYPEWQDSVNNLRTLQRVVPGSVVDMILPSQQQILRPLRGLVLAVRHRWNTGTVPTKTIYGVGVRDRAPEPLVALSAFALDAFNVAASVRISDLDPAGMVHVDIAPASAAPPQPPPPTPSGTTITATINSGATGGIVGWRAGNIGSNTRRTYDPGDGSGDVDWRQLLIGGPIASSDVRFVIARVAQVTDDSMPDRIVITTGGTDFTFVHKATRDTARSGVEYREDYTIESGSAAGALVSGTASTVRLEYD